MKKPQKKNSVTTIMLTALIALSLIVFTSSVFAQCEIGAFVGNDDHVAPTADQVNGFEQLAQKNLSSVLVYWAWNDGAFPAQDLYDGIRYREGYDTHTTLQLVWEPWSRMGANDTSYSLQNIVAGDYDAYITQFAQDCRDWGDTMRLRFAHEMIQDDDPATAGWYPWQDRPELYIQAWNHVRTIFKEQGADNVEFVWAPNSFPFDAATIAKYYPGINNVDWLGMDGYNAGEDGQAGWPYWQNFYDIFTSLYMSFLDNPDIFGDKKIMLAEFASAESPYPIDKATWIKEAFEAIKNDFTEIDAFYWFNVLKEYDWRIDSSPESLAAFQQAIADAYFTSHVVPEPSSLILLLTGVSGMLMFTGTKKVKGRG